jgi:hypothetical protein
MLMAEKIAPDRVRCPSCGTERSPQLLHSVSAEEDLLDRTIGELGLPARDILWARRGADSLGIEIAGDKAPF